MRDVYEVLTTTLEFFQGQARLKGVKLPKQQFVHIGDLAWDYELFVVHANAFSVGGAGSLGPGNSQFGNQLTNGGIVVLGLPINIELVRSVPNMDNAGRGPMPQDLSAAAQQASQDGRILSDLYFQAVQENVIVSDCNDILFNGVTWSGPSGGMLGTILSFSVQL